MKSGSRANALLVELLIVIIFFMFVSVTLVEFFAASREKSVAAQTTGAAILDAQNLAEELYGKALQVMETVPGGEPEQAITWLNMVQTVVAACGMEDEAAEKRIGEYLERAEALLDKVWKEVSGSAETRAETGADAALVNTDPVSPARRGYAAFVFEKCAPMFLQCGWFAVSKELKKRAEELYRGNEAGGADRS